MGGRKSKYSFKLSKDENNIWRVAVYIRLSVEDGDDKQESNSIKNQRNLINMFMANDKNLVIVDYYIDDGYSGTDFNRPDFQRMLRRY